MKNIRYKLDMLKMHCQVPSDKQLLESCASIGDLDTIKMIIENKFEDINCWDSVVLRIASEFGKLNIVKYALYKGSRIHSQHDYAIINADLNQHWEVLVYLLKQLDKEIILEKYMNHVEILPKRYKQEILTFLL